MSQIELDQTDSRRLNLFHHSHVIDQLKRLLKVEWDQNHQAEEQPDVLPQNSQVDGKPFPERVPLPQPSQYIKEPF